ncbi:Hypothetical protein GLP15_3133 [Giardia lamblia P15]|uniref:Uncharacterized protein n=1 Tax=Giardia intestinalis (strain P15) TaxID=658858 RepID=E1EVQ9_GIAIA|nr:Hypothetical protein GLP15_3133 [Giardia lamblia P15]
MDIKQRFPFLNHDVKEAMRSGRSISDVMQTLQHTRQEYLTIPRALFLRYVHAEYIDLTLESSVQITEAQRMASGHGMPPRPRVSQRPNAHLNTLLTRFVRERVASARERPSASFVTPERIVLDRVAIDEPETITIYADPRVMGASLSLIRIYSSCHSLQVSSKSEGPLLRISVRFLPSVEGLFKGSIVLLVGTRRTIVPIEAYVTPKPTGTRISPSPLLQPIRVPGLPMDSNKLPRKTSINKTNKSITVLDSYPTYPTLSRFSPDTYDRQLAMAAIPYQSPTETQMFDTAAQRPLSNGCSLSVGAIAVSDSECEPAVSYQTHREPSKPRVSPTSIIMVRKRSSLSQRAPIRSSIGGEYLNDSGSFRNLSLLDKPSPSKQRTVVHSCNSTSPMFSAPSSCLKSSHDSESEEFICAPVLKDIPQLIESIVDLNENTISTQDPTTINITPSPQRDSVDKAGVVNLLPLQLFQVVPRYVSEHTDCDPSTTWGSLTDGDSSCEDALLSTSQVSDYAFTTDELEQMSRAVADWNAFSQFDTDEQVDITDGGAVVTVTDISGWHTSRLNLLTDITYNLV